MLKPIKIFVVLMSFMLVSGLQAVRASTDMIIEVESPLGFEETIEKIKSNAKALGWKVPKSWKKDFQKNLLRVTEEDVGRNQVFSMCQPWEAVKLLKHDKYKKFFAMMPCSFAVYEKSDGKIYASFMNIQMLGQMYQGDKEIQDLVSKLGPEMVKMVEFE